MVLPEGTRESEGTRPKTLIAVGAALILLLATIVLGIATAPDDVTARESTTTTAGEPLPQPTTTTTIDIETFTVGDIATGERLSWWEAPRLDAQWPIELLARDGRLYLFTSNRQSHPRYLSSGLQVWVSDDGIAWERVAEVSEASVTSIAAAGDRLVAMGTHIEDDWPHLWISENGVDWSVSRLPMNVETAVPISTWMADAAMVADRLVVTGSGYPNPQAVIMDRLPPDVADFADRYGMSLSGGPDGRSIEIYGPMGILGYSATMEELGIDEETAVILYEGSSEDSTFVWSSVDGVDWTVDETSGPHVERMWNAGAGELFASGWDHTGPAIWSSADGITWSRLDSRLVNVVDSWDGWLLGTRNDRDVVLSRDGQEWQSVGTDNALPQSLDWYLWPVAMGPGGVAAVATTWVPSEDAASEPTSIEIDGQTLTIDQNTGDLTIEGAMGSSVIPLWGQADPEQVKVDFANERIRFMDVDADVELLSVSFERLREVEMSLYGQVAFEHRALLVNRGDNGWRIFDLAEEMGEGVGVLMIRVLEDRMILVTHAIPSRFSESPPAWSIRVATLP